MSHQWQQRERPFRLERRAQFESYDDLRDFLDRAAEVSEQVGFYPDMSFGQTHVTMTIQAPDDSRTFPDHVLDFARQVDEMLSPEHGDSAAQE
ncbi:MAG: 4a-hydroxytetrahydrobiopterin dehydratase [Pseudomonadota bacterium]